jgi:hypothetical protein
MEVLQSAAEHVSLLLLLPGQPPQPVIIGDALEDPLALSEEDVLTELVGIL